MKSTEPTNIFKLEAKETGQSAPAITVKDMFTKLCTHIKHHQTMRENKNHNFTYITGRIMSLCSFQYANPGHSVTVKL